MKSQSCRLVLWGMLVAAGVQAGNEARGRWIHNRIRARAFDGIAELCRDANSAGGLSAPDIIRLENAVATTVLEDDASLTVPAEVREAGGGTRKIVLRAQAWEHDFDANVDVFRDILSLYLQVIGYREIAPALANLDTFSLLSNGRPPFALSGLARRIPLSKIKEGYWKALPEPLSAEDAARRCKQLNEDGGLSPLAQWKLPEKATLVSEGGFLRQYLDSLPYKTRSNYTLWAEDLDGGFDLNGKQWVVGKPDALGVICFGVAR